MAHLINKDALVAEIRRYIKSAEAFLKYHHNKKDRLCYSFEHQRLTMCELLSFIDTLEVKKVNFVEELNKWYNNAPSEFEKVYWEDIESFAKHFFELGLKVQKGE